MLTPGYQFRPDGFVEFNYTRIDTEGNVRPPQYPTKRLGVRLQGRLLMPMSFSGGGPGEGS